LINLTFCWHAPAAISFFFRTPEEFEQGHCEGAVNIPIKINSDAGSMVDNPAFDEQVRKTP
jgi:rhodanese-related sulfurtransferase